jgi:hypothetical protein
MKNLLLIVFLWAISLQTQGLLAQRRGIKQEKNDNQKTSKKGESDDVEVVEATEDADSFGKTDNSPKNILKISPLDAFDGTFPIYFERVLSNRLTFEVGVGITTSTESFIALRRITTSNNDFYDGFHKSQTGAFFKVGMRYYVSKRDDAPEGIYFGIEHQVKVFKFETYPFIEDGSGYYRSSTGPFQEAKVSNWDLFRFVIGYQSQRVSNFTWDPFVGIAYQKTSFEGWVKGENGSPVLSNESESKPVFLIGFKMGILF